MQKNSQQFPFRKKVKSNPYAFLILVVCCVLLLVVCVFPLPIRTDLTMNGAEITKDGSIAQTGTITLDITLYHYLFRSDEVKINDIQILDLGITSTPYTFTVSGPTEHRDICEVICTLQKPGSTDDLNSYLFYNLQDPAFTIIKTDQRLFVGSVLSEPDYLGILEQYEELNFWGIPY